MNEAIDRRCVVFQDDPTQKPPLYRGSLEECLNWCEENANNWDRLVVYQPVMAFVVSKEISRTPLLADLVVPVDAVPHKRKYTRHKKVKRGKH